MNNYAAIQKQGLISISIFSCNVDAVKKSLSFKNNTIFALMEHNSLESETFLSRSEPIIASFDT